MRTLLAAIVLFLFVQIASAEEVFWKAGVARAVITPEKPHWLAGYGSRDHVAEGKLHDLWIKVLALEDPQGHRGVILTSDVLGFPKVMYDSICAKLSKEHKLDPSRIILSTSHTHSGPVLRESLLDYYPLDDKQLAEVEEYSIALEAKVVETVSKALSNLAPARLCAGQGITRFGTNRRNNPEAEVPGLLAGNTALKGPVDHSVPVLVVRTPDGKLTALLFGYACHTTTLGTYVWCGDYAGFAQVALEKGRPDTTAMFFLGCGADQNPLPRRTVELCERYGAMLASAVEEVLREPMRPVAPSLGTAIETITLDYEKNPTRQELEEATKSNSAIRVRWAKRMLKRLDENKPFEKSYPYPVQVWKLGQDMLWISLGGEVVIDYALRFKKEFGSDTWVIAYANDLMAYIPSRRVYDEGGYEGGALYEYMLPADRWAADVEDRIAGAVHRLVEKVGK